MNDERRTLDEQTEVNIRKEWEVIQAMFDRWELLFEGIAMNLPEEQKKEFIRVSNLQHNVSLEFLDTLGDILEDAGIKRCVL